MPSYHGEDLTNGRKSMVGSEIGSMKEVREMLEFSAEYTILPKVEMIKIEEINDA